MTSSVPVTTEKLAEALGNGIDLQSPAGKAFLHTIMQAVQKLEGQSGGKTGIQALEALLAKLGGKTLPDATHLLPLLLGEAAGKHADLSGAELQQLQALAKSVQPSDKKQKATDPAQLLQMILSSLGISQGDAASVATAGAGSQTATGGDVSGAVETAGGNPLKLLETLLAGTEHKTANLLAPIAGGNGQDSGHNKDGGGFDRLLTAIPATTSSASAQVSVSQPTHQGGVSTPTLPVQTPVGQHGWGQEVGAHLVWMTDNKIHQAKLQMNPPELGPLDVHISVHNDHTNVVFNAHHAATHDALQQDLPRLKTMLVDNGFASVDVNVSQGQQGWNGNQPGDGRNGQSGPRWSIAGVDAGGSLDVGATAAVAAGRGLVDHYA